MKRTALFLAAAATLGLGAVATPAQADFRVALGGLSPANAWGSGPSYYGDYVPSAYDSYVFSYQYPVYTGRQVTAIAVDMSTSRFRHRRVTGPGVAWYGSNYPRFYRVNRYW